MNWTPSRPNIAFKQMRMQYHTLQARFYCAPANSIIITVVVNWFPISDRIWNETQCQYQYNALYTTALYSPCSESACKTVPCAHTHPFSPQRNTSMPQRVRLHFSSVICIFPSSLITCLSVFFLLWSSIAHAFFTSDPQSHCIYTSQKSWISSRFILFSYSTYITFFVLRVSHSALTAGWHFKLQNGWLVGANGSADGMAFGWGEHKFLCGTRSFQMTYLGCVYFTSGH